MNKQKKVIIAVLTLVVTMMVGYALFSDTITINGTATSKGEFDIKITKATITTEKGSSGTTATITNNGKNLTINVPKLEYPSAYVDVSYDIENTGTIPALFKNYSISGETNTIKSSFVFSNFFYDKGDKHTERIRIYWDENSNITGEETTTITLKMNFEQIEGKEKACETLKATAKCLEEFEATYDETLPCAEGMNFDFDHDGVLTSGDATIVSDFVYQKMKCPN